MKKRIILASASPRREVLMSLLKRDFQVVPSTAKEVFREALSIEEQIEDIAFQKANSVFENYPDDIVLGADTVVVVDQEILGKPNTEANAISMLKKLSGRSHYVITAVAILSKEKSVQFHSKTEVVFYELTDDEIENYVYTKEPLDKAGAYTIQEGGAIFIKEIKGDYYTVMGFPIAKIYQTLKDFKF